MSIHASMQEPFEQAQVLLQRGRLPEALKLARELARRWPGDPRYWKLLSTVHLRFGQADEAAASLKRSLACAPDDLGNQILYGQCLARIGRRREALAVAESVAGQALEDPALRDGLGTLFSFCDEPARAIKLFDSAVILRPDNMAYRYNLATAQRMTGDMEAAEASLDAVIARKPDDWGSYYTRAGLRTQTPARNHIDAMLRALGSGPPHWSAEVPMCFALAKELEDIGDYARSFALLKRGCDLQRAHMTYDVVSDIATIDRIIERHDGSALSLTDRGFESPECIFVFGLPRSGTTLVERILSAHSQVYGAGELPTFPCQVVQAVKERSGTVVPKFELVELSLKVDPYELGQRYVSETRPQTGHTSKFVDKLPLNYLYAALIRRALPRARMVALVRSPMDSCYAMYKTLFTGAYPFTYDLSDLGRYYCAWHRLMRHWQSVLGEALLVIRYEELVANQEVVSRNIFRHCGLDWEDASLMFHQQDHPVATASAVQVRRPIYASSVGRWRHYAVQLAELARHLESIEE
ncbi:MAG: sulfotransferase [Proteobacteria bacterium]|nr:sulfotransferase [Pseudomonadota bacterium]